MRGHIRYAVITLAVILSIFYASCDSQNTQIKSTHSGIIRTDTISILTLRNIVYGHVNYSVVRLQDINRDSNIVDSTKRIELLKDNKAVADIFLPGSEEIKNFSVDNISETKEGFKIAVNWGGGNNFYSREFDFKFAAKQFYLACVKVGHYAQNSDKETVTKNKIRPLIAIEKFNIGRYIDNE